MTDRDEKVEALITLVEWALIAGTTPKWNKRAREVLSIIKGDA